MIWLCQRLPVRQDSHSSSTKVIYKTHRSSSSSPHNTIPFLPLIDMLSILKPMRTVEKADKLMQQARVLYKEYKHIMTPIDRTLAEDRMA